MDYQLIVIGAGPGGYTAALRAAALGLHTAVVECREVGGTCLNRGCIPTKTLLHASQVYRDAVDGASMGVHAANATFDMGEIFAYKRGVSEKLRNGIHGLLKSARVDLIEGVGRIAAPGQVDVTAADGAVSRYTAERILIATGSVNVRPPIPGLDLPGVMTSDELLEGCDRLYDSLVIIGGGVIGVEFATFYRNLGCAVTLVEGMDRLLPNMDRELGQNLQQIMKKQGVEVLTNAMVQSLEQTESGLAVHVLQKGAEKTVTGEKVLCAIGRRAYWDGVFAEGMNPETRGKSLKVDENFQTSIPGVYAIGDCVFGHAQLAHTASAMGEVAAENICGHEAHYCEKTNPTCVYMEPEAASVGLTEEQCKAKGIDYKVGKFPLVANGKSLIINGGEGLVKIIADAKYEEVLGMHIIGPRATDLIAEGGLALRLEATVDELISTIHSHPTVSESVRECALNVQKRAIHIKN